MWPEVESSQCMNATNHRSLQLAEGSYPECVTIKLRAWTPQTRGMSYSVFPLSKNNLKITSRHLCNLWEVSHTVKPVCQTWDFIKKKSCIQKFKLLLILFDFVLHLTQNSNLKMYRNTMWCVKSLHKWSQLDDCSAVSNVELQMKCVT